LGEALQIILELERNSKPLTITAFTVRYHAVMYDKIFYVPLAFDTIDAPTRDRIRTFVERKAAKRS
jgi:hypothetical protein